MQMAASCKMGVQARRRGPRRSLDAFPLFSSSHSCIGFKSSGTITCKRRELALEKKVGLNVCCQQGGITVVEKDETTRLGVDGNVAQLSVVMKFGGSSVASAERMKKIAELILSFPEERPVVVLSASGKTTNKLLLAGEKAVSCGVSHVSEIDELSFIKDLHPQDS